MLRNSKGTLEYIKSRCISLSDNVKTHYFSTLYTTISHTKLNTMQKKKNYNTNAERRYQNLVLAKTHPTL